jgi:hypothetical protein
VHEHAEHFKTQAEEICRFDVLRAFGLQFIGAYSGRKRHDKPERAGDLRILHRSNEFDCGGIAALASQMLQLHDRNDCRHRYDNSSEKRAYRRQRFPIHVQADWPQQAPYLCVRPFADTAGYKASTAANASGANAMFFIVW